MLNTHNYRAMSKQPKIQPAKQAVLANFSGRSTAFTRHSLSQPTTNETEPACPSAGRLDPLLQRDVRFGLRGPAKPPFCPCRLRTSPNNVMLRVSLPPDTHRRHPTVFFITPRLTVLQFRLCKAAGNRVRKLSRAPSAAIADV